MTETQMTSPTAGDAGSTEGSVESGIGQTVEEVNASWQHRFSQRDRAHNAETAALKEQIEALKTAPKSPPEGESPEAARVRALEAELQQERAARQAVTLQTKYPNAAAVLGESMVNLPVEKLAAIEAMYEDGAGSPPIIDPNSAPRRGAATAPAAKPINEKSKDELLGDLRRLAPAYQQAAKDGLL